MLVSLNCLEAFEGQIVFVNESLGELWDPLTLPSSLEGLACHHGGIFAHNWQLEAGVSESLPTTRQSEVRFSHRCWPVTIIDCLEHAQFIGK